MSVPQANKNKGKGKGKWRGKQIQKRIAVLADGTWIENYEDDELEFDEDAEAHLEPAASPAAEAGGTTEASGAPSATTNAPGEPPKTVSSLTRAERWSDEGFAGADDSGAASLRVGSGRAVRALVAMDPVLTLTSNFSSHVCSKELASSCQYSPAGETPDDNIAKVNETWSCLDSSTAITTLLAGETPNDNVVKVDKTTSCLDSSTANATILAGETTDNNPVMNDGTSPCLVSSSADETKTTTPSPICIFHHHYVAVSTQAL